MAISFYRKKIPGQPDAFYEVGTNRYIGPTEFGKGVGFTEVAEPTIPSGGVSPATGTRNISPAGSGGGGTTAQPNFNTVREYYEQNVIAPERKRFEETLAYQRGLQPRSDIITAARNEVGLPDIITAKERTKSTIDQLNNYLDKLTAELQIGMSQIERTSQPQVLAGRQGAFLQHNIAAEKAPIALGLGQAQRTFGELTDRERYLQDLANQLAEARIYQAEQPLREYEARNKFESQQSQDLYKLLLAEAKAARTGTSELNKLLTPVEAARLGVPYGTTRGEAALMGKIPRYGRAGSAGSDEVITKLNKFLTGYPTDFKSYIKSIAGNVGFDLTASSIGQLYEQYNKMKSQGVLPSGQQLTDKALKKQHQQEVVGVLKSVAGADGYVSPDDWRKAKRAYVEAGYGTATDFDKQFSVFKNPQNRFYEYRQ
jgi:hypothetical protein